MITIRIDVELGEGLDDEYYTLLRTLNEVQIEWGLPYLPRKDEVFNLHGFINEEQLKELDGDVYELFIGNITLIVESVQWVNKEIVVLFLNDKS